MFHFVCLALINTARGPRSRGEKKMHAALHLLGAYLFMRMIPIPMIHRSPALIFSILDTYGTAQEKAHLGIDSLVAFWAADFSSVTCTVDASAFGPVSHPDGLRLGGILLTAGDWLCGFFDPMK